MSISPSSIKIAYNRIQAYVNTTPILQSSLLNEILSSHLYFKFEGAQKVGAFKARGAINTLLSLKEMNHLPKEIVAYSSGNHAQAVAWAAQKLGIKATIIVPKFASEVKIAATRGYGANIILTQERQEAEDLSLQKAKEKGCFLLPPYDHDDVIIGQGTSAFEAWQNNIKYDAVFAPCGGGGLLSGTYLATRFFSDSAQVFAAEPSTANDASRSYHEGKICRFSTTPQTIADGARTLGVSERTFHYIKQLDGFYEITEDEIIYWSQWLMHLMKVTLEPTAALGMAAAYKWINEGNEGKSILIIISGANLDPKTYLQVWQNNYLNKLPTIAR
ncbi:MAG: serine/threonine dehydratase [Gammaproteobacteria bacterium 39-13]|nr:serine/threonine dehydratase [Gammaproteobacteria bacterium]OJV96232.1 MAG: serine/threonine dehydratase [Gammaproteobacteria bacterium 39-13]